MGLMDTSVYGRIRRPMDRISSISGNLAGMSENYQNAEMRNMQMQQAQINLANQKRKQEQEDALRTRQTSFGRDLAEMGQVPFEEQMDLYREQFPMEAFNRRLGQGGASNPFAERRMALAELKAKQSGQRLEQGEKRLVITRANAKRMGLKDEQSIAQFNQKLELNREKYEYNKIENDKEREDMLGKNSRDFNFAQTNLKKQIPEYLQGSIDPERVFTQTMMKEINASNNSYGDIYKKIDDLQLLVPNESVFKDAKGFGETGALVRSQVAQIITDYNRNIAELGALAGQDLTILEEAIPSPSKWKLMSYNSWKKTMEKVNSNIKEKYQNLMNNYGVMVSGDVLDSVKGRSSSVSKPRLTTVNQTIADELIDELGITD